MVRVSGRWPGQLRRRLLHLGTLFLFQRVHTWISSDRLRRNADDKETAADGCRNDHRLYHGLERS
jgi:hypothetical protein